MPTCVRLLLLCAVSVTVLPTIVMAQEAVAVAIIAHPGVALDSLSRAQLLDYYTGDIQRWPDGTRVVVTDLKAKGAVRDGFYEFLGRRPSRMKSIWLRRMLSGEGEPPEVLETEEDVLRLVARTPGALGFVNSSRATPAVRVLLHIAADADRQDASSP